MKDLQPKIILPGHGPVQHDLGYVDKLGDLLASLQEQVNASAKQGLSLEETRKKVDLGTFRAAFAGQDATQQTVFDQDFVAPAIDRAYEEAHGSISTDE